ncbi:hypothetical protein HPB50_024695 [Hyalomma asiaticum]|uniref:Uncharacterized protein n=1 Tax=Hyalomma asiaticum TaxID=266040 RepID=A0ACB7TNA8_HYAAI|nr:hypothetical protein HPB50_024695 [Hyalomma asiaticum]
MQEILPTKRNTGNEDLASAQSLAATNEKLKAEIEGLKTQVRLLNTTGSEQQGQAVTQRHDIRETNAETSESRLNLSGHATRNQDSCLQQSESSAITRLLSNGGESI